MQYVKMSVRYQKECCFHNHPFEEAFLWLDASSLFLREAKHILLLWCLAFLV